MRTGHLFAGAGGGLYADLILGHKPVFAVEWERYPADCLREAAEAGWFPGLHVLHGDVRLFDPSKYKGRVDSLHAGFPCQDISVAGAGKGIEGERSGLWKEVKRVAGILQPRELFLENSPAITTRGLGVVLGDLAELGYDAIWCVLSAASVGAPHLRPRWWCLARKISDTNASGVSGAKPISEHPWAKDDCRGCIRAMGSFVSDTHCKRRREAREFRPDKELGAGGFCETVADASGGQCHAGCLCAGRQTGYDACECAEEAGHMAHANSVSVQRLQQKVSDTQERQEPCERSAGSQGNGDEWWSVEPGVGRVAHGVALRSHRIKCLGNGQVPLQAAAAYTLLERAFGECQ